jgi:hypothetical protein
LVKKKTRYLIEITGFYLVAGAHNHHNLRPKESSGEHAAIEANDLAKTLGVAKIGDQYNGLLWVSA